MPYDIQFSLETIYLKGNGTGHSMVITGAVHGNEQTGTHTAYLLAEKLKNEKLLGDVKILPICNETAFRARQRQAPEDSEDLNRIFPGNPEGSFSHRLANHIWRETEGFDYLLDLHCCGLYGHMYTMCWYSKFKYHHALCQMLGIDTVIHTAGTSGQLYIESSEKRNQKALLIELPGGQPSGFVNTEAAHSACDKIINYMKLNKIIAGEGVQPKKVLFCGCRENDMAKAEEDGFYQMVVKPGQLVRKNDIIALVNGKEMKSPIDAVVTGSSIDRYVFKGDSLVSLASSKELSPGTIQ